MQHKLELVKKFSPQILFDKNEPFFPIRIGYTIFENTQKSPSFPREIVFNDNLKYVIEYAIYWDFDIEHLYDLEHIWVYIDKDGKICNCEGSFHGKFLTGLLEDRSNILNETHIKLYSQPGKHAFLPLPEFFKLVPNYKEATYEFAGRDGLIVTKVGEGRYSTSPEINKMVHEYMKKFKFQASMEFENYTIPENLYVPWTELYEEIPALINEKLDYIKQNLE
jgi:hypothetical protein